MTHCFEEFDRSKIVELFYRDEPESWHRDVHENGGTCDENVASSLKTISTISTVYRVIVDGSIAAFFALYKGDGITAVEAFHIKKEFRDKKFIPQFWKIVKKQAGGPFKVGVYMQNIDAINHLRRQGFELDGYTENKGKKIIIFNVKK